MLALDVFPEGVRKLFRFGSALEDLLVEGDDVRPRVLGRVVVVVDGSDTGVLDERRSAQRILELGGRDLETAG